MRKKLKILEVTAFSAGICGVWTRVLAEAKELAKKNEVYVFSSDIFRGGEKNKKASPYEEIDNVKITRFPANISFGQNTFFWDYEKQALDLKPDIIVAHAYRQYYSTKALKIARKLKVPCFLVTHAPFLDKKLRNWRLNLAVFLYDNLIGKRILNNYSKIIAITKWEIPYLLALGAKKDKIEYSPNGIPDEFFKIKLKETGVKSRILFLGRVAPIKNLETLIKAIYLLKNKKIRLDIVGPEEPEYKYKIVDLIKKLNLKNIHFYPVVYNLKKKIKIIDEHDIFVLPSKREGMPQALIEAMARGKIVVSSSTQGGKELINNGKNGFIFEIGNEKQLKEAIERINNMPDNEKNKIRNDTRKSVEKFSWNRLIKETEKAYSA